MSIVCQKPKIDPTSRFTVTQSAKILGVHRNTIRTYCNSGLINFSYRVGKRKVILGKELIKLWDLANSTGYERLGVC